ncbi:hypothetical protein D3C71_943290 [compost metagenome]
MPVGRTEQPEGDNRLHEGLTIKGHLIARSEQIEAVDDPGSAIVLILLRPRHRERLAEILLGLAQQATVAGVGAVKTFDDKNPLPTEGLDFDIGGVEAERAQEGQTEVFVLDAVGKIDGAARHLADLRLKNVGGRRGAVRLQPLAVMTEEGGFVLNASE